MRKYITADKPIGMSVSIEKRMNASKHEMKHRNANQGRDAVIARNRPKITTNF